MWLLISIAALYLSGSLAQSNCVSDETLSYSSNGDNSDAEFYLPSCGAIEAPVIALYLEGSGTITFSAEAIEGNIMVYASASNPTYTLSFPNLQTLNGTLNFVDDASGATMDAPEFTCWQSPDGELDTVVTPNSDDTFPDTMTFGTHHGLTIQGSLSLGSTTPMYFNPSFINLKLLGGLVLSGTNRNFTFSALQSIGSVSLNNANAGLSFPVLKVLTSFGMSGSSFGGMGASFPLLQRFTTSSVALNTSTSSGSALFGGTNYVSMGDNPICDCSDSSSGFSGCDSLCSSTYEPTVVSCSLVPIYSDDDYYIDIPAGFFTWIFFVILFLSLCCCFLIACAIAGSFGLIGGIGYCCCAIVKGTRKESPINDPILHVPGQGYPETTATVANPMQGNPVGSGAGDFRSRGDFRAQQPVGSDYRPPIAHCTPIAHQA